MILEIGSANLYCASLGFVHRFLCNPTFSCTKLASAEYTSDFSLKNLRFVTRHVEPHRN